MSFGFLRLERRVRLSQAHSLSVILELPAIVVLVLLC
jgi:hypothetical protein